MFVDDVGESTWEEIDDGVAGANYGWPTCEALHHGTTIRATGLHGSVLLVQPRQRALRITGGDFYNPQVPVPVRTTSASTSSPTTAAGWIEYIDPARGQPAARHGLRDRAQSRPSTSSADYDGNLYYLARGSGSNTGVVSKVTYTGSSAPAITQDPGSQLISTGHPVTFTVAASGARAVDVPVAEERCGHLGGELHLVHDRVGGARRQRGPVPLHRLQRVSAAGDERRGDPVGDSNQPPTATISAPPSGTTYKGGDTINYAGSGTDPETGRCRRAP